MGNLMRWRYGDTNPVVAAVDSATVIEIGDLIYLDTDDAKPASSQADQETKAANQALFAGNFLGVAMQQSRAGDTTPIRVATTGTFEFSCTAGTFELGDLIGSTENTGGDGLEKQKVEKVTTSAGAFGRVTRREASSSSLVMVSICSTVMAGGIAGTTAAA